MHKRSPCVLFLFSANITGNTRNPLSICYPCDWVWTSQPASQLQLVQILLALRHLVFSKVVQVFIYCLLHEFKEKNAERKLSAFPHTTNRQAKKCSVIEPVSVLEERAAAAAIAAGVVAVVPSYPNKRPRPHSSVALAERAKHAPLGPDFPLEQMVRSLCFYLATSF